MAPSKFHFEAVGIEYAFATFLGEEIGKRGLLHDADMFRVGEVKSLGKLLEKFSKRFRDRVAKISFNQSNPSQRDSKIRLNSAINALERMANEMKKSKDKEPEDYHWLIIRDLVNSLTDLLNYIEQG